LPRRKRVGVLIVALITAFALLGLVSSTTASAASGQGRLARPTAVATDINGIMATGGCHDMNNPIGT
jgi:hypothetical protein